MEKKNLTDKQKNYLLKVGFNEEDIKDLSVQEAYSLISKIKKGISELVEDPSKQAVQIGLPLEETTETKETKTTTSSSKKTTKKAKTEKKVETPKVVVPEPLELYLNDLSTKDKAFSKFYKHDKLGDCWNYIVDYAKQKLNNKSGALTDDEVFQQARHYFTDVLPSENKEEKKETNFQFNFDFE